MGNDKGPNFKFLGITIAVILVLMLIFAGLTYVLVRLVTDVKVDVGIINIDINGHECNISADLDYSPDIGADPKDLRLVLDGGDVPLGYKNKFVYAVLDEPQFTEIVDNEKVRIRGTVETKNAFGISSEREIDEDIDLSFLGEIFSTVEITEAKISTRFPSTAVVDFNLTVDMDREVNIYAVDTEAIISTGERNQTIDLVHLELTSVGSGMGTVEFPTSTLLTMGLFGKNVTIDTWGLSASFKFPFV
jgi:hypothetical protein